MLLNLLYSSLNPDKNLEKLYCFHKILSSTNVFNIDINKNKQHLYNVLKYNKL